MKKQDSSEKPAERYFEVFNKYLSNSWHHPRYFKNIEEVGESYELDGSDPTDFCIVMDPNKITEEESKLLARKPYAVVIGDENNNQANFEIFSYSDQRQVAKTVKKYVSKFGPTSGRDVRTGKLFDLTKIAVMRTLKRLGLEDKLEGLEDEH
jgi:hypothetical protein